MLGFLRRKMKIILWFLVAGITVTFVFFGINTQLSGPDDRPASAGELFGKKITLAEFDDAAAAVRFFAFLSQRPIDRGQVNSQAWDRLLMLSEAERQGIAVSDNQLAATIMKQFSPRGRFDQTLYENSLRLSGIPPGLYERWLRESLMIQRLIDTVSKTAWLPDTEIENQLREQQTKTRISYRLVGSKGFTKEASISGEEIKDFYEKNLTDYRTSPRVNARYVLVKWDIDDETPEPGDEEIKSYYEATEDAFQHAERVRARHILFSMEGKDREAAERKALSRAEKVMKKLGKGKDFAALAKKYSNDKKTKKKGGDLGFIERKDMPGPFSDKAFSLQPGETSEPVKTARGYHLITIEERQEPGLKPIEEVREEIASLLKRRKKKAREDTAKKEAYSKAVEISLALVDDPDLGKAAGEKSLSVEETGPISEKDTIGEIGYNREFNRAAFETEIGSFSDIVELPGKGYAIVVPIEKIPEETKPLEDVRDQILEKLKAEKARKLARERAAAEHSKVKALMEESGKGFAPACEKLSLETKESPPFSAGGFVPGLGFAPDVAREASELKEGELSAVLDTSDGSCFFTVAAKEPPAEKDLKNKIDAFRTRALRSHEGKVIREWEKDLRLRAAMIDYLSVKESPDEETDTEPPTPGTK